MDMGRSKPPSDAATAKEMPPNATRTTDPDSDVLGLVAIGDMTGALRRLMKRHGSPVYRYCREALRDATLADDVQQQVFIEAFRDLPKFHGRSSVKTWLYAIARHRVLDAAKSRHRAQAHIAGHDATHIADARPTPGESIDDVRLRAALWECLEQLREAIRTPLLLRYQQGFTFEDMAAICSEKPGTLQAKVTRALPVLKTCIEQRTEGVV